MPPIRTNSSSSSSASTSAPTSASSSATSLSQTPFIKHLASSHRPVREQALASLRTYLTTSRPFTHRDCLLLWKGLFYCMWHSDRPRPQQLLAADLANLIVPMQQDNALAFYVAFWETMAREWTGIDALRMDKYLLLVRRAVAAGMRFAREREWEEKALGALLGVWETWALHPSEKKVPVGLRLHVCDVWVDEMARVAGEKEGEMPVEKLLEPVRALEREGAQKVWRKRAREALGDERLAKLRGEHGEDGDGETSRGGEGDSRGGMEADAEEEWGGIED